MTARVRPSAGEEHMGAAPQSSGSACSPEEDEEKSRIYKKWLDFPAVSNSLLSNIIGVVMSNTVHVFFTERQLCLPDRLVTAETLDRTIASLLSSATTMALLLTIAIQLMFMDWTPIDPGDTVFPDQDFARDVLARIGQSLAGFSGVMIFCYVYAASVAAVPLLNSVDHNFLECSVRRYVRTAAPWLALMSISGGYLMFITTIIASWVKFDVPVAIAITVGAVAGWLMHSMVVAHSFIALDPISSQWLSLPGGKERASQRLAFLQGEPVSSVLTQQSTKNIPTAAAAAAATALKAVSPSVAELSASFFSGSSERGALMSLLTRALSPKGQVHETRVSEAADRFCSQDLSVRMLTVADASQLWHVLSHPSLGLSLGEQLMIHRALEG